MVNNLKRRFSGPALIMLLILIVVTAVTLLPFISIFFASFRPGREIMRQGLGLNLDIRTAGTLNALTLDALTLDMKGTEANIETLYLMQGETVLAQAAAAAQVTLTLETPATLAEYNNTFTLAADIKTDATVETAVDAALLSLTLSGTAKTVQQSDVL